MAASTEVVLADLTSMATTFRRESAHYAAEVAGMTPAPVDSGDEALDGVLAGVLNLIDVLNAALVSTLDEHGERLASARDAYADQELDNRFLYDELMPED